MLPVIAGEKGLPIGESVTGVMEMGGKMHWTRITVLRKATPEEYLAWLVEDGSTPKEAQISLQNAAAAGHIYYYQVALD